MRGKIGYHARSHLAGGSDPIPNLFSDIEAWQCVIPVAPATLHGDDEESSVEFESPWANIGGDVPATAFRSFGGKTQIRVGCVGGADDAPSLIFTLPADHLPDGEETLVAVTGEDRDGIGSILILIGGDVYFQMQIV